MGAERVVLMKPRVSATAGIIHEPWCNALRRAIGQVVRPFNESDCNTEYLTCKKCIPVGSPSKRKRRDGLRIETFGEPELDSDQFLQRCRLRGKDGVMDVALVSDRALMKLVQQPVE